MTAIRKRRCENHKGFPSTSVTHMSNILNQGGHVLQIASGVDASTYGNMHQTATAVV